MEYFQVQNTSFAMSDKRKYIKNPYAGKKRRKTWNKPKNGFPTSEREILQVRITTKVNGSMNMNMEKVGLTMNIKTMTLI